MLKAAVRHMYWIKRKKTHPLSNGKLHVNAKTRHLCHGQRFGSALIKAICRPTAHKALGISRVTDVWNKKESQNEA